MTLSAPRAPASIQARRWLGRARARTPTYSAILPNIAARVQAAAAPVTVLVTADTHRLISGLFVV
jgi:class 3 adenylate cyclase